MQIKTTALAAVCATAFATTVGAQHSAHFRYDLHGDISTDFFGNAVAIIGDMDQDGCDDFAVAATSAGAFAGAVRTFSGADGRTLFTWNGDSGGDVLGRSVAPAGDVNNDGYADVVAGAYQDDNTASNAGSVRVFSGKDGSVLYNFDGTQIDEWHGYSVHGAGDVNLDGFADIIAGSPGWDTATASDIGKAVVYSGKDGSILATINGDASTHRFGHSVCGMFDADLDFFGDYAAGGPGYNGVGRVKVYSGLLGGLLYTWTGATTGQFGHFLANGGDVNADGHGDVIVSGYGNDMVHAYSGKDGTLLWNCPGAGDGQGWTCGGNSDVDNDGYDDIISGPGSAASPGNTMVFSGKSGQLIHNFNGYQSCGGGDLNGDGHGDVLAGTWLLNGIAWIYSGKELSMRINDHLIPLATGGTQNISLVCGGANANRNYWIFGSVTGSKPGISLLGLNIPLNIDPYTDLTIGLANFGPFQKFRGTLDASGNATASLVVPNNVTAAISLQHAAVVFDANGKFHFVTNAAPARIQ